ncbi:hypothetical protein Athai_55240 [Actinocatenispora thailandica]|uniref:DUF4034 domain-containing protein n=1 Tax=Actinocatenispora thailandica TaxID=227318 RepID=A0A7R7DUJ5_9ACTN|nr:hypothetical protein [Actinocatenispora thailandica]BCJ38021.1 hypothetical protein Athai_55240 [Actinocatenispora thailandica]
MPDPLPSTDAAVAYPKLRTLRRAIADSNGGAAIAFIDAEPDPTGRTFVLRYAAGLDGALPVAAEQHARRPDDPTAAALYAATLIEAGWQIRSGRRAREVSTEQFHGLHDHLRRAEQILIDRTAADPDDATAWVLRLITARGLELGANECRRRYDRSVAAQPHNLPAQQQFLQQLCPKWTGTFDEVHEFARQCWLASPPGSPNGFLVAIGHLERWLELGDAGGAHLRQQSVHDEVVQAAEHSVWYRGADTGFYGLTAHSTFAMYFSLVDDRAAAARHFAACGGAISELPWAYLGDAARQAARHRARVTGAGQ